MIIKFIKFYWIIFYYGVILSNESQNPVILYNGLLYDFVISSLKINSYGQSKNPIKDKTKVLFLDRLFSKNSIKNLLDFIFYHRIESSKNKNIILDDLYPELKEIHHYELLQKEEFLQNINKNLLLKNNFFLMMDAILEGSMNNDIEALISNYYFSIYTQKYLIVLFLKKYISNESPEDLNSLFYHINHHYPENDQLNYLNLLVIKSYYDSLSPLIYQININYIYQILYLIKQMKKKKNINLYQSTLKQIKNSTMIILCEKEIYKSLTLISNGQIAVGYNILHKQLKLYKKILNKPLKKYNIFLNQDLHSFHNKINPITFSSYKKKNYWAHRLVTNQDINHLYFFQYPLKNKNIHYSTLVYSIDLDKIIIKSSLIYKKFKIYQKKYQLIKKFFHKI